MKCLIIRRKVYDGLIGGLEGYLRVAKKVERAASKSKSKSIKAGKQLRELREANGYVREIIRTLKQKKKEKTS